HAHGVGAGGGNVEAAVGQPLAAVDPADVVAAAAVAGGLDVDVVGAVRAAAVARRGVVVRAVVLRLEHHGAGVGGEAGGQGGNGGRQQAGVQRGRSGHDCSSLRWWIPCQDHQSSGSHVG